MNFTGDATWLLGYKPSATEKTPVDQLIPAESRIQHQKWVHTMFCSKTNIRGNWDNFFTGMLRRPRIFLTCPTVTDNPRGSDRKQPVCLTMQYISEPDSRSVSNRHWTFSVAFEKLDSTVQPAASPSFFKPLKRNIVRFGELAHAMVTPSGTPVEEMTVVQVGSQANNLSSLD